MFHFCVPNCQYPFNIEIQLAKKNIGKKNSVKNIEIYWRSRTFKNMQPIKRKSFEMTKSCKMIMNAWLGLVMCIRGGQWNLSDRSYWVWFFVFWYHWVGSVPKFKNRLYWVGSWIYTKLNPIQTENQTDVEPI